MRVREWHVVVRRSKKGGLCRRVSYLLTLLSVRSAALASMLLLAVVAIPASLGCLVHPASHIWWALASLVTKLRFPQQKQVS